MKPILIAFSIASAMTAGFAFRFRNGRRPLLLAVYFVFFFVCEGLAGHYLIPPDAFGLEVAYVCLGLTVLLVAATALSIRYDERREVEEAERGER